MYLPEAFREDDEERLARLIGAFPFGMLVTTGAEGPLVSHIPMTFVRDADGTRRVLGHLARANPHSQALAGEALAVFMGPHAYVSPTWYETQPSVPTWNYAVVHAAGPVRAIDDPQALAALVRDLAARFEDGRPQPWRFDALPDSYRRGMLRGIVGFEIRVARLEGKFKLGQNRSAADRARVAVALAASADPLDRATAELMTTAPAG